MKKYLFTIGFLFLLGYSADAHVLTAGGNANTEATDARFGSAALQTTASSGDNAVTAPDSADFNFGANSFTVDFWVRFEVTPAGTNGMFCQQGGAGNRAYNMTWDGTNLKFQYSTDGTAVTDIDRAWTPSANTNYHIAAERSVNDFSTYIDGVRGTITSLSGVTIFNSTANFAISGCPTVKEGFAGLIDEFRVSSVARYSGGFTPPTSAYCGAAANTNTVLLASMNGADEGTTFTDTAGTTAACAGRVRRLNIE